MAEDKTSQWNLSLLELHQGWMWGCAYNEFSWCLCKEAETFPSQSHMGPRFRVVTGFANLTRWASSWAELQTCCSLFPPSHPDFLLPPAGQHLLRAGEPHGVLSVLTENHGLALNLTCVSSKYGMDGGTPVISPRAHIPKKCRMPWRTGWG